MAAKTVLELTRIVSSSGSQTTCIIRCLHGSLVDGQRLRAEDKSGFIVPSTTPLIVVEIWRYEKRVDLVDAPHVALVILDGFLGPDVSNIRLVGDSEGEES